MTRRAGPGQLTVSARAAAPEAFSRPAYTGLRSGEFGLALELVTALQLGGAVRVGRQFPDEDTSGARLAGARKSGAGGVSVGELTPDPDRTAQLERRDQLQRETELS